MSKSGTKNDIAWRDGSPDKSPGDPGPVSDRSGSGGAERPGFDELYLEYRPILVRFARSRNAIDPEGVADLALLDGLRALDRLRSDDPRVLRSYLFKATASHVARERRKRREEPSPIEDVGVTDSFEEVVAGAIDLEALLETLPADQRDVLRHRFVDDLSAEETAARLGKTSGAVRMLQLRAIRRLRRTVFASAIVITIGAIIIGVLVVALRNAQNERPAVTPVDRSSESSTDDDAGGERRSNPEGSVVSVIPVIGDSFAVDGSVEIGGGPTTTTATGPAPVAAEPGATSTTAPTTAPPTTATTAPTTAPPSETTAAEPGTVLAYDGFASAPDVPASAGDATGPIGFEVGAAWFITAGEAEVLHDPVGLTYRDAAGATLAATPGGAQIRAIGGGAMLRRRLADPALLAGSSYWVSFLIRPDRPGIGDAFWTPDGHMNVGAAGIQQHGNYRFVNGNAADRPIEQGETTLIVVNLWPEGGALWVDPFLDDLGRPLVLLSGPPSGTTEDLMVSFNEIQDGAYTIDEIRVGTTARTVTPIG